jgi:hypothetical protein
MRDTEGALGPRECFLQGTIEVAAGTGVLSGVQVENIPSCWKRFAYPFGSPRARVVFSSCAIRYLDAVTESTEI